MRLNNRLHLFFKGKKKRKERNQAPNVGVRILKSNWCPLRRQMQTMKMFKAERKRAIIQRPGPPPGGGEVLPIMAYKRRLRLQVYERVGILIVEVYKRVGKSVIWACERAQRVEQMNFMAL